MALALQLLDGLELRGHTISAEKVSHKSHPTPKVSSLGSLSLYMYMYMYIPMYMYMYIQCTYIVHCACVHVHVHVCFTLCKGQVPSEGQLQPISQEETG